MPRNNAPLAGDSVYDTWGVVKMVLVGSELKKLTAALSLTPLLHCGMTIKDFNN